MVYGVLDEKSRAYYTFLGDVFDAIGNEQLNYNWLITDSEIAPKSERLKQFNTALIDLDADGKSVSEKAPEYFFLSGQKLTEIVRQENSQWIWGVLSGFHEDISLHDILKYPLPVANGHTDFWKSPPSIQHPLASIEIVPWDSSLVLLFSRKKEIVERFRLAFPESQDLPEHNAPASPKE